MGQNQVPIPLSSLDVASHAKSNSGKCEQAEVQDSFVASCKACRGYCLLKLFRDKTEQQANPDIYISTASVECQRGRSSCAQHTHIILLPCVAAAIMCTHYDTALRPQ